MKIFIFFIALFFPSAQIFSQCEFDNDEFDEFDKVVILDTKKEKIYSNIHGNALRIGFGNYGYDYYYMTFSPIEYRPWDVFEGAPIRVLLTNGQVIDLRSDAKVRSDLDVAKFLGLNGTTNRQTADIHCAISQEKLDLLFNHDIKKVRIEFRHGLQEFEIKKKKNYKHAHLIECLDKRIAYWKKKHPNASLREREKRINENNYSRKIENKDPKTGVTTFVNPRISSTGDVPKPEQTLENEMDEQKRKKTPPVALPEDVSPPLDEIFKVVEQMPRFPGCEDEPGDNKAKEECAKQKMNRFIYGNLQYPEKAKAAKIEGMCVIQFVIDKAGNVVGPKVIRDIGAGCGQAALDVVNQMNDLPEKWRPGFQRGKPVKILYTLPIRFRL